MSYEKLPEGRGYKVRWRDSAGRQRSKKVNTQRDAISLDGEMKRKKIMGELIVHEKGTIRLCDFWDVYWKHYAVPNLSPRTRDTYLWLWRTHLKTAFGSTRVNQITAESVVSLISGLSDSMASSSVRKCVTVLQGVLERAVEWGYIASNPAKGIRKPPLVSRTGRALSSDQVSKLCSELDARSVAIVLVLSTTGLRPGELRGLRWSDIGRSAIRVEHAVSGNVIGPTKTNKNRSVDLRPEARKALLEWYMAQGQPGPDELAFPAASGRGVWTDNGYRIWALRTFADAASRAGLKGLRPYDLRHTFVSTLVAEGSDIYRAARQTGHSPEVMLSVYSHLFECESVPSECPANVDMLEILRAL